MKSKEQILLFRWATGKEIKSNQPSKTGTPHDLEFSPDGKPFTVAPGNELRTLHVCCSASFTADGQYLVTAGEGVLRVWGIPH